MKHLMIAITLLSGTLLAQSGSATLSATSPANSPSYSQMYCSGFVSKHAIPRTNFVVASKESPQEDQIPGHSQLFLGGPALVEGQRYSLLRQVSDPDITDSSLAQRKKLEKLGSIYQEIGWVTVHSVEKGSAIATFDFACDSALRGDIVVPFNEKPTISSRAVAPSIDTFHETPNAVKGQILGSKDFDSLLGDGHVVYTDFGTTKGAKVGDYLVITRGYAPADLNVIDRATEQLPKGAEVAVVKPARIKPNADSHAPQRVVGELLVLNATAESSTAMIVRTFAEVGFGDIVQDEIDHPAGADAESAKAPEAAAPCQRPSILHRIRHLEIHACK